MPSIVNEKGTEMMDFSTTGDERTIEHTAKLKLSIQEIACLVEDEEKMMLRTVVMLRIVMVVMLRMLLKVMMTTLL